MTHHSNHDKDPQMSRIRIRSVTGAALIALMATGAVAPAASAATNAAPSKAILRAIL